MSNDKTQGGTKELTPAKTGRKRPVGNPAMTGAALMVEPGDNTKFLLVNQKLLNMPDINLRDEAAVRERLNEYFALYAENDMKPTVAGMAMALGMHRRTLWAIVNDAPISGWGNKTTLPATITNVIKKAYILLENLWESYMVSGKINPVSGIFLGKNHYGYRDQTEYVVTPNSPRDSDYDAEAIRRRYMIEDNSTDDPDDGNVFEKADAFPKT